MVASHVLDTIIEWFKEDPDNAVAVSTGGGWGERGVYNQDFKSSKEEEEENFHNILS